MKFVSTASALNLRDEPSGAILGELLAGDLIEISLDSKESVWAEGKVLSGKSAGLTGFVRRKWLAQYFVGEPVLSSADRTQAARIVAKRTAEFDLIHYKLGDKAGSWPQLKAKGYVDCSGWVYLLAKEIVGAYGLNTKPGILLTFSDEQITNVGKATKQIVSGQWLTDQMFLPGCIVGIDFAEYSWDRGRPLDIDHIVMIGQDESGLFVSQSSSLGGGVNRVELSRWLKSTEHLRSAGRVYLVDLLQLP